MEKILTLKMEMIKESKGINFKYSGGIVNEIADKLSDERLEKIKKLIREVTNEISEGLAIYEVLEELENEKTEETINELKDELYKMLPDDMKKEIDEFRSNMNKFKTPEEKLMYAFQELAKTIDKK